MARKKSASAYDLRQFRSSLKRPKRNALKPFASGEHAWLGNAGAAAACVKLRAAGVDIADVEFSEIPRLHADQEFDYGELVALSGDFYGSPSELYEEHPSQVPWLYQPNDLVDLKTIIGKEVSWIEARQRGQGPAVYPENNVRMAWNAKSYLELALKNVDHFGWHNLVAYSRYHTAALQLAKAAKGRGGDTWSRALVYNAFADHFLTDGFAAGHIRVPRAEIRTWAVARKLKDTCAGVLSKVLHDQDGHVATLHGQSEQADGLPVCNARGDSWKTFCDGQLFLFPGRPQDNPAVKHAVDAVADSVCELVTAWRKQRLPKAEYAATKRVPFPDPRAPGLAKKFSQAALGQEKIKAIFGAAAWYQKLPLIGGGMAIGHLRDLFDALPELMRQFREAVTADLEQNPSLRLRIAEGYADAYAEVQ